MNTKFDDDDLMQVIETFRSDHPTYRAAIRQMFEELPQGERDELDCLAMETLGNPEPDGYAA